MRSNRVLTEYPHQTVEFIPIADLRVNGEPITNPLLVEVAVLPDCDDTVDETWNESTYLEGRLGFMLDGPTLGRGVFKVLARILSVPERPVLELGRFRLV